MCFGIIKLNQMLPDKTYCHNSAILPLLIDYPQWPMQCYRDIYLDINSIAKSLIADKSTSEYIIQILYDIQTSRWHHLEEFFKLSWCHLVAHTTKRKDLVFAVDQENVTLPYLIYSSKTPPYDIIWSEKSYWWCHLEDFFLVEAERSFNTDKEEGGLIQFHVVPSRPAWCKQICEFAL